MSCDAKQKANPTLEIHLLQVYKHTKNTQYKRYIKTQTNKQLIAPCMTASYHYKEGRFERIKLV